MIIKLTSFPATPFIFVCVHSVLILFFVFSVFIGSIRLLIYSRFAFFKESYSRFVKYKLIKFSFTYSLSKKNKNSFTYMFVLLQATNCSTTPTEYKVDLGSSSKWNYKIQPSIQKKPEPRIVNRRISSLNLF